MPHPHPHLSLHTERARLVDEKFLGRLTPAGSARLTQIDQELEGIDAPRVAALKASRQAESAALVTQIAGIAAKIEKRASSRPQTKTAGSH